MIGAFSPFTFRVIIESYEFSATVLSVDFMFVEMSGFFTHSGYFLSLIGAFHPFIFRVIIERYGFSVIVLSVGFMLVMVSLILCGPCNISINV